MEILDLKRRKISMEKRKYQAGRIDGDINGISMENDSQKANRNQNFR